MGLLTGKDEQPVPGSGVTPDQTILVGVRVLVADDAPDIRALIQKMLEHAGAEVQLAFDGVSAVEMATSSHFDVVLMDIQMPEMDGYEATQKLRSLGYTRPVLALTAQAKRAEIERSMAAGCDECLSKPVPRKQLVEAVRKHLARFDSPHESLGVETDPAVPQ